MARKKGIGVGVIIIGIVVLAAAVFGGFYFTRNLGKTDKVISQESAHEQLARLVGEISPTEAPLVKSAIEAVDDAKATYSELPELDTHAVVVDSTTDLYAEIWSSGEKAGSGTDGYLREMAEQFNRAGISVDGKPASVRLRSVSSGESVDYMASGKATPDGYTPSNQLFVSLLNARGVSTTTVRERLVGNAAGILLDQEHYDAIVANHGTVDLKAITEEVAAGKLLVGYTNPFTSATGLNFLLSCLLRYDASDPLSATALEGFKSFQSNVPFVSLTTQQMRDAAERDSLDGFVTEYQVYANDQTLRSKYKFTPFGYRHDNPLVAVAGIAQEKLDVLEAFANYCDEHGSDLAARDGFGGMDSYVSELPEVDGATVLRAQQAYKENKDSGVAVVGVFVCDVSGSMDGEPINSLQSSLVNSMRYINKSNYIGLVSYSDDVVINLPIAKFDMTQQSYFKGAVESLRAGGGTATFDGIAVATKMIEDKLAEVPGAKPMLFVLSDGETNRGFDLADVRGILQSLRIPVYTIGYNADLAALKQISEISEAASIDASTSDVAYQLKNLFNANM